MHSFWNILENIKISEILLKILKSTDVKLSIAVYYFLMKKFRSAVNFLL
jgi:hypothetical protein